VKSPRLILGLMALAQLTTAQLPAQGPKPLGLQQPAPLASAPARRDMAPTRFDTTHVKPNHWKRGAVIGFVATAVPMTIAFLATARGDDGDCSPFTTTQCTVVAGAAILSVGALGALVGGLIGAFFLK